MAKRTSTLGVVWTLAAKDLRLLLGDKMGLFFSAGFPLLMASLFGSMYSAQNSGSDNAKMPVIVIDQDHSTASKELIERFTSRDELEIIAGDDVDAAARAVLDGERTAYVVITKGFQEAIDAPFWGESARVELAVDPSQSAAKGMLQGLVTEQCFAQMMSGFSHPERMQKQLADSIAVLDNETGPHVMLLKRFLMSLHGFLGQLPQLTASGNGLGGPFSGDWRPIELAEVSLASQPKESKSKPALTNSYAISFPQGIIWGILGAASAFGISLVVERTRGTLTRLRMAPISRAQVLAGKGLACFLVALSTATLLFIAARLVFGVVPNSLPMLICAVLSICTCFVGVMMCLAVVGRTEAAAGGIGWSILMVLAMFGGGMMPLYFLPTWMQQAGSFSPVKWSILAMEGAIWRGFDWGATLEVCAILIAIGIACFTIGVLLMRRWDEV